MTKPILRTSNQILLPLFLVFAILTIDQGCKKTEDPAASNGTLSDGQTDLNGNWTAKGYTCPAGVAIPTETIQIVQTTDKITATKVIGDNCVPTGKITFVGTYDASKKVYNIKWTTGTPTSPASDSSSPGILTVTDKNNLTSTFSGNPSITFSR